MLRHHSYQPFAQMAVPAPVNLTTAMGLWIGRYFMVWKSPIQSPNMRSRGWMDSWVISVESMR